MKPQHYNALSNCTFKELFDYLAHLKEEYIKNPLQYIQDEMTAVYTALGKRYASQFTRKNNHSTRRRIIIIPFNRIFAAHERDYG